MRLRLVFSALLATLVFVVAGEAQWLQDGVPICTAENSQTYCAIVSDGFGGAIITWVDGRTEGGIYAQRVNPFGVVQWTIDGVPICTAQYQKRNPAIVYDGFGGAIITWEDNRKGTVMDIYAQWVDSSGAARWTHDGVEICAAIGTQWYPVIASDGLGGAIIAWQDSRSGIEKYDVYAQRVRASGEAAWITDGVPVCTATGDQTYPTIVSDGFGGAIITWEDTRAGGLFHDIFAQRVDSSGTVRWTADGISICSFFEDQRYPVITSYGVGGAIIAWMDRAHGAGQDIYAQRVDSSGMVQWTVDGVCICGVLGEQKYPVIVADGAGGAVVAWTDERGVTDWDIYAQRFDSSGAVDWDPAGVAICVAPGFQGGQRLVLDGSQGAIMTWEDQRRGSDSTDIYAQRVDCLGAVQWTPDGIPICTVALEKHIPVIAADGSGGAIIAWQDARGGIEDYDIYAQRVDSLGQVGVEENVQAQPVSLKHVPSPSPNPFVSWTSFKGYEMRKADVYDLCGQKVGEYPGGKVGADLASGIYFASVSGSRPCKIVKVK
jgi:predicted lipoprotein with Yx(FWY)xxD motif